MLCVCLFFFFFNDPATTEIYTLSLHDALPIFALARALYKKPQLLLMDEATSAMDRNTEGFVLDLLRKARDTMGIILVTHRVKTAKDTDRIYVIEDGVIKASGSHSELLKSDNLYSNSWKDFQGPSETASHNN